MTTESIRLKEVFTPIISTLILIGLVWVGNTVNTNSINIGLVQKDIGYINLKLAEFKNLTNDRFTATEAKEAFAKCDLDISELAARVRDLETGK
jgi:hypothetical protein|tara:strand:- start:1023 stop:1304 length:282 start_codon:yes stop_codon:yes gene_type:complete